MEEYIKFLQTALSLRREKIQNSSLLPPYYGWRDKQGNLLAFMSPAGYPFSFVWIKDEAMAEDALRFLLNIHMGITLRDVVMGAMKNISLAIDIPYFIETLPKTISGMDTLEILKKVLAKEKLMCFDEIPSRMLFSSSVPVSRDPNVISYNLTAVTVTLRVRFTHIGESLTRIGLPTEYSDLVLAKPVIPEYQATTSNGEHVILFSYYGNQIPEAVIEALLSDVEFRSNLESIGIA